MAKPKVIVQLYPMFPSDGEEDRKAKRPLGNDNEMYHRIVHEWTDIIKEADKMGVWGLGTIEHHFHSEGYEVGPNPGILNAYWASLVENAHVGALGYVMATHDPLRVAEETAILDHLTKGKYFVGFARGYQSRWANVMGQYTESPATVSDGSAADDRNRQIFEERVNMVIEAWTQESVRVKGEFYEAPFPFETGVEGYPAYEIARDAGAEGEIGPDGSVQRVCVVPKPYQQPHPPVFVAASKSQASIDYCARNGFIPTYFMPDKGVIEMTQYYQKVANENGFNVQLGQKQNLVRWPHVTKTSEDFDRKLREYDLDIYKNFYGPFFPQFPTDPNTDFVQNIKDSGIYTVGTADQVRDEWRRLYDQVPCEYITLIYHFAQQPKDSVIKELELFMTKVLPHLEAAGSEPAMQAAE